MRDEEAASYEIDIDELLDVLLEVKRTYGLNSAEAFEHVMSRVNCVLGKYYEEEDVR